MNKVYRLLVPLISLFVAACVKQHFSVPADTGENDPELFEHISIAALRSGMGSAGAKEITQNIIISGVVIADDRHGNLYKQVIIDDGTGAIPVLLDAYNLYNDFPVGRAISIRCKGLYTGFYYKLPQLGFRPSAQSLPGPIPFHLWDHYLLMGSLGNEVPVTDVLPSEIKKAVPELYNRLVRIRDLQCADTGVQMYALPSALAGASSLQLADCDGNLLVLRTSGYSSFQSVRPPKGNGTLTAIYTVFNSSPQLILRDTADIQFNNNRCL